MNGLGRHYLGASVLSRHTLGACLKSYCIYYAFRDIIGTLWVKCTSVSLKLMNEQWSIKCGVPIVMQALS